ncbi:hypothetical protein [Arthrobacter sp. NicSoilB8]|uniref:hypothetical protein n=1 Tax=Arthrobacter sp. NicSoilB8 TaxID=2830998 RepID=UPI001CC703FD|nr:hypothetical protein [Arthrobacter sp. NicSoilB8]
MFFWIIVLSFLIPMGVRLYRRSVRGRNQGTPGQFGRFPGNPNNQSNQPRDGYTQQDYFGGFGQLGAPKQPGQANGPYPGQPYPGGQNPGQQYPGQPYPGQPHTGQPHTGQPHTGPRFPEQPFPNQPYPGQQYPSPAGYQSPVPYEDSPEYLNNVPQRQDPAQGAGQPPAPPVPQSPSAPQGYRARKLAELDQKYSDGKLSMEDYMAQRAEIMKG